MSEAKTHKKGFSQRQIFVPYSTVNVFLAAVPMQYIHYGLARCTLTLNLMAHLNVSYPPNSARAWYSGRSMPDIKHLDWLYFVPQCTSMFSHVSQCTSMYLLFVHTWMYEGYQTVGPSLLCTSMCAPCEAFARIANCSTLIAMSPTLGTVMELYIRQPRQEI